MMQALTRETTVQPGGVVTVEIPELPVGAKARVVVLIEEPAPEPPPLSSLIGTGARLFKTVKEVDDYIRAERDAWEE